MQLHLHLDLGIPGGSASRCFTFQVTATSSVSPNLVSAPATVTVIVQPATDTIVISNVVYRRTKGRLIVNASDFTPGVTLTCTLDIINPAAEPSDHHFGRRR